jgi:hypothetical protein
MMMIMNKPDPTESQNTAQSSTLYFPVRWQIRFSTSKTWHGMAYSEPNPISLGLLRHPRRVDGWLAAVTCTSHISLSETAEAQEWVQQTQSLLLDDHTNRIAHLA